MRALGVRATMSPSMSPQHAVAPDPPTHPTHPAHDHLHDRWCGHAQVAHDDHLDFLHDGHLHHPDGDHVDDRPGTADALHLSHVCHMHVHGPGCGHAPTDHDGHLDFLHGQHLHAIHDDHYDEH